MAKRIMLLRKISLKRTPSLFAHEKCSIFWTLTLVRFLYMFRSIISPERPERKQITEDALEHNRNDNKVVRKAIFFL